MCIKVELRYSRLSPIILCESDTVEKKNKPLGPRNHAACRARWLSRPFGPSRTGKPGSMAGAPISSFSYKQGQVSLSSSKISAVMGGAY